MNLQSGTAQPEKNAGSIRKPYARPQLVSYGHVEKLTGGASAGVVEGGNTMKPSPG